MTNFKHMHLNIRIYPVCIYILTIIAELGCHHDLDMNFYLMLQITFTDKSPITKTMHFFFRLLKRPNSSRVYMY